MSPRNLSCSHTEAQDVVNEGFPEWYPWKFIDFFCKAFRCDPEDEVTVIQWKYLDE